MTSRAGAFERWIRTSFVELNTELENLYFAQAERAAVIGVGGTFKAERDQNAHGHDSKMCEDFPPG